VLFMGLFFFFAIVDYIMLKIADDEDGYDVPASVTFLAEWIFFYTAIMLMIMAVLSNWTKISFLCSEKAYIQGLLNVSIVGFFILLIARKLRPPAEIDIDENTGRQKVKRQKIQDITWHKYHNWNNQIDGIVLIVVVLWIMLVFFFVISVAAFAEFAKEAAGWGVAPALSSFVGFAMVIMLAPPAPGNIIDVFGGYLIVVVLIMNDDDGDTWDFWTALPVAIVTIVVLHYTGACFQWIIGRRPFAQQWMNRTFPIEMLATSDAVLGDANWFKVGLVGFVFLDTANGLNQGRIEMEFWTQLWSEWGAWPNGICLVTFGATLGLNGLDVNSSWTAQAIPILFIMSGLTTIVGTTLGASALAGSLDTDKYIMSREKWHIVHTLMKVGYFPTKIGWEKDVYELATSKNGGKSYFDKACALQHEWLEVRKSCHSDDLAKQLEDFKWNKWIPLRYQDHIKYLLKKIRYMEDEKREEFDELLKKTDQGKLRREPGMWDDVHNNREKKICQTIVVVTLVVTFYFGILGFWMSADLEVASKKGLDFLWSIQIYYWISAGVFVLFSCIYYWDSLKRSFGRTFSGLLYFIRCCPVEQEIETGFLTPTRS